MKTPTVLGGETMDWLKFIHIVGAMVWLGGGLTLILVGLRARGSTDPNATVEFARTVGYVGRRLLGPAWVIVLTTGVWMVLASSAWKFSQLWVLIGLGAFALAFLIGVIFLARVGIQLERTSSAAGGTTGGSELVDRWIVGYALVLVALLIAVWDMVFKPGT